MRVRKATICYFLRPFHHTIHKQKVSQTYSECDSCTIRRFKSFSLYLRSSKGDPPAPSVATRVQAPRFRRRLLLAAKASRRPGCRKIREMGTPAESCELRERNAGKPQSRRRRRRDAWKRWRARARSSSLCRWLVKERRLNGIFSTGTLLLLLLLGAFNGRALKFRNC